MSSGHSCKHTCSFKHNKSKNWSYMMPWHCTLVFGIVLSLLLLVKIWGLILVEILKLDFGWNSEAEWWSRLVSQEHQSPHFHLKLSVRWIFQTRKIPRSPDGDDSLRCDLKAVTFVEAMNLLSVAPLAMFISLTISKLLQFLYFHVRSIVPSRVLVAALWFRRS